MQRDYLHLQSVITHDTRKELLILFLDISIIIDIINVRTITEILAQLRNEPHNVRFSNLCKLCEFFFGPPRQCRGSHMIYRTPWQGDPRINIQNNKGRAKAYQAKQVLKAIERLELKNGTEK
jgi:hypothetical protein